MTGCPLCRATSFEAQDVSTRMVRSAYSGATVVRCTGCGLDYISPRPVEVDGVYKEDYCRAYQDAGMVFPTESILHPRFAARLRAVERIRGRGRLLEIGVGHGGFLHHAATQGWDVLGVELSAYAGRPRCAIATGSTSCTGRSSPRSCPGPRSTWCISATCSSTCWIRLARFGKIRTVLAPGGVLAIEVPNELENLHVRLRRLFGGPAPYPVRCTHITFFQPSTLQQMLERAGYRVTRVSTMRDATDPGAWRGLVKRAAGAIERPLGLGPLIEAFATPVGH